MTLDADELSRTFRNLSLSYRGSERQPPNNLQLALRFSRAIELHQESGKHPQGWCLEERLAAVVTDFHDCSGLTAKHRIDPDRQKSIFNLISGTCPKAREVLAQHLDRHKWRDSAFSSEQMRSSRWVLGTSPKMQACPMKKALSVTEEAQCLHLRLVVHVFTEAGRRVRPTSRSRLRLSQEQFDKYCDFACIFAAALAEARQLTTFTPEKEAQIMKCFFQKCHE